MKSLVKLITVVISLLIMLPVFGQDSTKTKNEIRIKIVKKINGKETTIDTTFTPNANFDEHQFINDINFKENMSAFSDSLSKVMQNIQVIVSDSVESNIDNQINFDVNVNIPDLPPMPPMPAMPPMVGFGDDNMDFDINIIDDNADKIIIENDTLKAMRQELKEMKSAGSSSNHRQIFLNYSDINSKIKAITDSAKVFAYHAKGKFPKEFKIISKGDTLIQKFDFPNVYCNTGDSSKVVVICKTNGNTNQNTEKVINVNSNGRKIMIITKCNIQKLSETDKTNLQKSGVKLDTKKQELQLDNLEFYPNPSSGKINLIFTSDSKETTYIKIYDINGKTIYSEKVKNFDGNYNKEINLSDNQKGIYFLHITSGKSAATRKIMLQ